MPAEAVAPARTLRILVVDDEPTVREMVGINLRADGYDVVFAGDGDEAIAVARSACPDMVVLDVMLPGRDGYDVCRTLRQESNIPILLLSARGEEVDRIVGLEIGADDYLTKPFAMRELMARVRAMIRRLRMSEDVSGTSANSGQGPDSVTMEETLSAGDIVVNVSRHEATVAGRTLTLTSKEFGLLEYLARHAGIVLSRDALLREVWGYDYPVGTRTVDVHVGWLRQKLESDPTKPQRIVTVRGHGYRLAPQAASAIDTHE